MKRTTVARPLLLFAHGAGAPSKSPWMEQWANRLETIGKVVRFDYPYMAQHKKRPDRHEVLLEAHREALAKARAGHSGPVALVGKSMGGRIGCHLALGEKVDALVCLGYPLVGTSGKRRDEVLLALTTPILFVQGTRDGLCPLADLDVVRKCMRAQNALHVVEGGDHSLRVAKTVLKSRGVTQDYVEATAAAATRAFLDGVFGRMPVN